MTFPQQLHKEYEFYQRLTRIMYEKDKTFRSDHIASFCLSGCRVSVFPDPVHGTGADHPGKREMTGMAGFFRTEDRAFSSRKKVECQCPLYVCCLFGYNINWMERAA